MEARLHPEMRPITRLDQSNEWLPAGMQLPEYVLEVVTYLRGRGLAADDEDAARILVKLVMLGVRADCGRMSVSRAARMLYMSRRNLGRRCLSTGLPNPSHILAFGRVLEAARRLQTSSATVFTVAEDTGWRDPFGLLNTMHRLTGIRPSKARDRSLLFSTSLSVSGKTCRSASVGRHRAHHDRHSLYSGQCGQFPSHLLHPHVADTLPKFFRKLERIRSRF